MANAKEKNLLGAYLKQLISQKPRTTLRTLENKTGVSRSEISNLVRGVRKNPNHDVLRALAKPLKVDPRYLIMLAAGLTFKDIDELRQKYGSPGHYSEAMSASSGEFMVNENAAQYISRFNELTPEGKALVEYLFKADEQKRKASRPGKSR